MQIKNWNDLTYLLAVQRGGSYAGAATILQVDDTTVSRRLNALQEELNTQLIFRLPDGTIQMTDSGEAILTHLDAIENSIGLIEETLSAENIECTGTVRITSVPIIVNRVLAPNVKALMERHPRLEIVLIPDSRDLSLSHREADLAVRLARPKTGGHAVKARKIGQLPYSTYVANDISDSQVRELSWIAYDDLLAHIPPAKWTNHLLANADNAVSHVRVHDVETALQLTQSGAGKALLPDFVASGTEELRPITVDSDMPLPIRDIWLLGHAEQNKQRRIVAVSNWVDQTIAEVITSQL